MTWQEKMNIVIGEVLGEGYEIKVIDDEKFEVYFVDSLVLKTETVEALPNHWRKHVANTIYLIVKQSTEKALAKL